MSWRRTKSRHIIRPLANCGTIVGGVAAGGVSSGYVAVSGGPDDGVSGGGHGVRNRIVDVAFWPPRWRRWTHGGLSRWLINHFVDYFWCLNLTLPLWWSKRINPARRWPQIPNCIKTIHKNLIFLIQRFQRTKKRREQSIKKIHILKNQDFNL